MIIDFVLFSIVRVKFNDQDFPGASAYYDNAAWTILASSICSLIGCVIVFLTCCSSRLHARRSHVGKLEGRYVPPQRRARWF
jgi:hypothetical protein